jgi:hypothetical protein
MMKNGQMMKVLSRRGLLAGLLGAAAAPAAFAASWVKLGDRRVRLVADHDVIPVTFLKGNFRRIKLRVRGNGIFINDLTVVYTIGGVDRIPIRTNIKAGGESRAIDLRGGDRNIRSVQLFYRSVRNSRGTAEVAVYGLR